MSILTAFGILALAEFWGGEPWLLVSIAILGTLAITRFRTADVVATTGVSIAWLLLFHLNDDRRLFFPFTMQYAVQAACLLRGRVARPALYGGGGMVALFLVIRILQQATTKVLTVELIVAAAVLGIALWLYGPGEQSTGRRTVVGAAASLMAFAGLAL